jgi:two-component system NtrC family response regulator
MNTNSKILLIDDEEVITFGFSRVLEERGTEVDCAQTAEEARKYITTNQYNAAIVDLRLSDSTDLEGFDLIRLLHASQSNCKIVVLTAYGDNDIKKRVEAERVDLFFEKPIEPEIVRDSLKILGAY